MKYRTILADPPWAEHGSGFRGGHRGADRHYPIMKTAEIIEVMKAEIDDQVTDDAHLYLWVTNNYLEAGLEVIREIGFRYITNLVWVKLGHYGLGQYFRGQHELLLFGARGHAISMVQRKDQNSVIVERKREHSRKPEQARQKIMAVSPGPYLELFARERYPGWDAWGNEVAETVQERLM